MQLQDFRLGETYISEPRDITAEDLELFTRLSGDDHPVHRAQELGAGTGDNPFRGPVLHGTFGLALFTGFFRRLDLADGALALLDTQWEYDRPVYVGDAITCEITVTRARASSTPGRGVLQRYVELKNQDGEVVQHGTSALLVEARPGEPCRAELDFGTVAWARAVAQELERNEEFCAAVSAYDGTIGLAIGREEVHFRIYRGRIIETSRRSLLGADFVVRVSEKDWCDLMFSDTNDFMKKAMLGRFSTSGSGAAYLRMTRVLMQLVDAARALTRKDTIS